MTANTAYAVLEGGKLIAVFSSLNRVYAFLTSNEESFNPIVRYKPDSPGAWIVRPLSRTGLRNILKKYGMLEAHITGVNLDRRFIVLVGPMNPREAP